MKNEHFYHYHIQTFPIQRRKILQVSAAIQKPASNARKKTIGASTKTPWRKKTPGLEQDALPVAYKGGPMAEGVQVSPSAVDRVSGVPKVSALQRTRLKLTEGTNQQAVTQEIQWGYYEANCQTEGVLSPNVNHGMCRNPYMPKNTYSGLYCSKSKCATHYCCQPCNLLQVNKVTGCLGTDPSCWTPIDHERTHCCFPHEPCCYDASSPAHHATSAIVGAFDGLTGVADSRGGSKMCKYMETVRVSFHIVIL